MSAYAAVTDVLKLQAGACAAMGSPFSGALLDRTAEALPDDPSLQEVFRPWAEAGRREIFDDAAALRWLAALHDAALEAPNSPLAQSYPGPDRPGDPARAWPLVQEFMRAQTERMVDFMRHEPQTNEVRRSAVLLPGFLAVAATSDSGVQARRAL
jgi:hypothetical protein